MKAALSEDILAAFAKMQHTLFSCSSVTYAAYPKLVSKILNGFEIIKTWIIKIATPAAAVAVRNRSFYEKI